MKYQVMMNMLLALLARRKVTAREIADKYEVSIRSVYRYVDELSIAGVPVEVERGRYGGITIMDTYKLPVGFLTKGEYDAVTMALRAMISQMPNEQAQTALEKVERQLKHERIELSICGNILVDSSGWGSSKQFSEKLQLCERAVDECRSMDIDYISREGEHTRRVIDPYVMILKQNVWYVYGFCHTKQETRTFKVGRMKHIRMTDRTFEKVALKRSDIPLDFVYPEEKLQEVTIAIDKEALPDVEEWIGVENVEPRGNRLIATITLPDDSAIVNKILSFGGKVKVLQPESLLERVKKAAKKIYEES